MKTILLIEDDPDMRDNTAELLELASYRVLKAENGRRGIDIARQEPPDLVICDIMMPELDGYGVLHLLARDPSTAEIPFIFVSAKAERAEVRRGMDLGADDYLTKPFEESELLNAVEGRLKRSELFRQGFRSGTADIPGLIDLARGVNGLKDLTKDRKRRTLAAKDSLFMAGDELRHVFLIEKGKVRTYAMNRDGKEIVTGLHAPGDLIGFMSVLEGGRTHENAEALEETELSLIPREDMLALLHRDRDVSLRFIKMLAKDVKEMETRLLELAYAGVRQRVAQALVRLRDRYAGAGSDQLGIRISREDIAAIVGTATESLIRALSDLRDEGIIGTHGREIRVLDAARLEKLART
ncbi:MAG TPA: response regulator [Flavobacteriales bacterium]